MPGGTHVRRKRPLWSLSMTPEAVAMADLLADARGLTRSTLIETLIRDEARRERLDPSAVETRVEGIAKTKTAAKRKYARRSK